MKKGNSNLYGIALMLVLMLALFARLGRPGLRAEEPRRAMVAIETFEIEPKGIPKINGTAYLNKPPLYIWIQGAMIQITGSASEQMVRIPGLIFYLLTALLIFRFVRRELNKHIAFWSSVFYLLAGDLFLYATVYSGEMDFFYSFLIVAQCFSLWTHLERKQYVKLYIWLYTLSLAGLLTKGLPSLHFHLSFFILIFWKSRSWRLLFHPAHFLSALLFTAALVGLYFWYEQFANAQLYALSLVNESVQKSAMAYSSSQILKHILTFPLGYLSLLMPWTLILLIRRLPNKNHWPAVINYCLLFIVINIWVYWISPGNHNRYLYMFLPPSAILLAFVLNEGHLREFWKRLDWLIYLLPMIGIALVWTLYSINRMELNLALPLLFSILLLLLFLLRKAFPSMIWFVVVFLLIGRLGMNEMYLPMVHRHTETGRYQTHVHRLAKLAHENPIYLYGPKSQEKLELNLPFISSYSAIKAIPPLLPYQIPYVYYRVSGRIMLYRQYLEKGNLYLAHQSALPAQLNEDQQLYIFKDEWNQQNMVLFRWSD